MKTIIAPVDFTPISLNAVNYAADLACVIGTDLSLIHICTMPIAVNEVPVPVYSIEELMRSAEEKLDELKEVLLSRIGERLKINTIVRQGDIVLEIDEYCASVNPYAIVMGAESLGAFGRFLQGGGKTIAAIKKLSWPLIAVPAEVKFSSLRKICLACDFKKVTDTIPVKEIKNLVGKFKAELHVLHINNHSEDLFNQEPVNESGWLNDVLGDLNPAYHFISGTDTDKSISEFVEKNNFDLLIIIPRKHSPISSLFINSHSKRLVLHMHVPVMAIHE
ncbi:MAG: universal stress protein [Chitinophagaceae bacterium]